MDELKAITTEDPAAGSPIGMTLSFTSVPVTFSALNSVSRMGSWGSCNGVILAIHFRSSSGHSVLGSGVMVAPGVALGAWHVFEADASDLSVGILSCLAVGITGQGMQLWGVRQIIHVGKTDLCILSLSAASALPTGNQFHQSILSPRLPAVGEDLVITGFIATQGSFQTNDDGDDPIKGDIYVCSGKVVDQYPFGRDRGLAPWPCISVACPSFGGMSGGPVFNKEGKLIGLLSSSFDTGPSLVSLIWPALTCRFKGGWPEGFFNSNTSLIEMHPKLCSIDDRSMVIIQHNDNGTISTHYRLPENENFIVREESEYQISQGPA